jgi:DNA-binding NtrC family response regulator
VGTARTVLVVDSDVTSSTLLVRLLSENGISALTCSSAEAALSRLETDPVEVVVSDLALPDMSGLSFIGILERQWPGLPVVVLAANASVGEAVAALKRGAVDFLQKPFDREEIVYVLHKALTLVEARAEQPPPLAAFEHSGILGTSPAMREVFSTIERAAQGTATVLVRGESGTGKELVARAIHDASPRADQPFVKIDCASLPENLLESELFGYEKGAFTGATARKPGRAELADKGTLFLDEIGELSLPLQAKILRLLQDREFERLGGTKTIKVDLRIVAATHRDLEGMVERQQFRLDLFYRLNVIPLFLPPLRARREDIDLLVAHFCKACGVANGKPGVTIDKDAVRALRDQRWPGNVRQLQNFVERQRERGHRRSGRAQRALPPRPLRSRARKLAAALGRSRLRARGSCLERPREFTRSPRGHPPARSPDARRREDGARARAPLREAESEFGRAPPRREPLDPVREARRVRALGRAPLGSGARIALQLESKSRSRWSSATSGPTSFSTSFSEKSKAVPGPRLVMMLPSTTTGSST